MYSDLRNRLDFFLRRNTKFSRTNFTETNPELIARNKAENAYTFDVLNNSFEKRKTKNVKILDIGCKNWFYVAGLHQYFNNFCDGFSIDGIELDAYRLYSNLYSRYEVAKYYMQGLENVNYIAGNLLNLDKKYDYITWFLPFVLEYPHTAWGLPKKYFYPEALLQHAYKLLERNGQMLIINQGEKEYDKQKELLVNLKIPHKELGRIRSEAFNYKHKRFGFVCRKINCTLDLTPRKLEAPSQSDRVIV